MRVNRTDIFDVVIEMLEGASRISVDCLEGRYVADVHSQFAMACDEV